MILEYTFKYYKPDDSEFDIDWEYEISDNDIEGFLVDTYNTKDFLNILRDTNYFSNSADDIEYLSDQFNMNFESLDDFYTFAPNLSMQDFLFYFPVDDMDFGWIVDESKDLEENLHDYFEDKAEKDFERNFDFSEYNSDYDFADDATFYAYKEGPNYWRR